MSPSDVAVTVLGAHESDIVSVMLLKDGLTNDSWLVRTTDDAAVVRINNPNAQALHVDREVEARILSIVASAGIGPEVLLCDPQQHLLVTRYLGPTCTPCDMRDPERIDRIAHLLRKLHELPPPEIPALRWQDVMHDYAATLRTMNRASHLLDADHQARAHAIAVELESSGAGCLCHNDVHFLNLIDHRELRLIDWEYAGVGDPYFDLASVAFYNDYDMDERATLLRAYEGDVDAGSIQRLAKACFVFEYVHDLWHEVRAEVGGLVEVP